MNYKISETLKNYFKEYISKTNTLDRRVDEIHLDFNKAISPTTIGLPYTIIEVHSDIGKIMLKVPFCNDKYNCEKFFEEISKIYNDIKTYKSIRNYGLDVFKDLDIAQSLNDTLIKYDKENDVVFLLTEIDLSTTLHDLTPDCVQTIIIGTISKLAKALKNLKNEYFSQQKNKV